MTKFDSWLIAELPSPAGFNDIAPWIYFHSPVFFYVSIFLFVLFLLLITTIDGTDAHIFIYLSIHVAGNPPKMSFLSSLVNW